ncbi:MAG: helix-turn-helix domain-containing protein [Aggregatilineales bacterium]
MRADDETRRFVHSDLTEAQRRTVQILVDAELEDSPAWLVVEQFNKDTLRQLQLIDMVVVSTPEIDEPKVRITGRGMNFYKDVMCEFTPRNKLSDEDIRGIIRMCAEGVKYETVASHFDVSIAHVSGIRRGSTLRSMEILEEMMLTPQSRRHRHPASIRKACLRMRREGVTYKEISERLGVPVGTLNKWIKKAGLANAHPDTAERRRIVRMYRSGMTYQQIADEIGRSVQPVKDAMKAFYLGVLDVS